MGGISSSNQKPAARGRVAFNVATLKKAAPAKSTTIRKKRATTGELLDNLSKYQWNFEAMKSAR